MKDKLLHRQKRESEKTLELARAESAYNLICFGDDLAKKKGYKAHKGMDAIFFYLIEKYHWLPYQARSLNFDDLEFLLAEEKYTWTLAADDRV